MTESGALRDIVVEEVFPHTPDKVWRALTTSALIARWLMPNTFEPLMGCKFTFQSHPIGDWDGVVQCEVLELEVNRRLVYSWKGGSNSNPKFGAKLDSVVTWTLTAVEGGTVLKMVHAGFASPGNDMAFDAMKPGWGRAAQGIGREAALLL